MNLENYNYWGDSRVRASMINHGKIVERDGYQYLLIEDMELVCKFEVCDLCRGRGTHTNPSIDCCGLTAEDFEDYDFREMYFQGAYDVPCNQCGGLRVAPVVDEQANPKELVDRYNEYMKSQYDHAAEVAAEKRMGC